MKAEFVDVPIHYHNIIQTLRIHDYRMNKGIDIKELTAQRHVQKLIKWMGRHTSCEPFWIDLLYMIIREFKILVVPFFKRAFKKIINSELIHKWNSKAAHVIRLFQHIARQIDQNFDYSVLGFTQLSLLMEKSIIIMGSGINFEIQKITLTKLQQNMYKFLYKARQWAKNCEKLLQSFQKEEFDQEKFRKERTNYENLKLQEEEIILAYEKQITNFEMVFYKNTSFYQKKCAEKFKRIIYELQKDKPHKPNFILVPYNPKKEEAKKKIKFYPSDYDQKWKKPKPSKLSKQLKASDSPKSPEWFMPSQFQKQQKSQMTPKTTDVAIQKGSNQLENLDAVLQYIDRFNHENSKDIEQGELKIKYELFLRRICIEKEQNIVKIEENECLAKESTVFSKPCKKEFKKNTKLANFETEDNKPIKKEFVIYAGESTELPNQLNERSQTQWEIQY